ncbi:MAG TPA: IS21-like element helper ATPase IstB [Blastocatellia bacterium]|jgi:DNA replication protein DnaC|nr:IS21-like element helper ATPase IstB [Blastocatellia bacterium]
MMTLPTTTTPNSNLETQLDRLRLRATAQNLDDFIARATKGRWSPRMLLEQLSQIETDDRSRRSLERRLGLSGIKKFKPLADFDWNWPKKIERDVIERALTLDFIKEARNLILIGPNGLGKTMIAKNICHAAVLAGYSVLFRSASALIEDLQTESPQARRRKLRTYGNAGLVCIDEVGYLSYDDNAADLLYEVINRRYERRSILVTTNRGFKEWNEVFPNASCIVTLVDRLTHHADVSKLEGESYRLRESEMEATARRRKK